MYDLTVAEAHTFAVGDGEWVVHNKCDFRRFGSETEATQAQATNQLEFPTSGVGNRQEKWIAEANSISSNAKFGDSRLYTHRMDIETQGTQLDWLNRNAVDYEIWRNAVEEGLSEVQRIDGKTILLRDVLVFTKTNEPGWYGLTRGGLGFFNRNIVTINTVRIR